MDFFSGLKKAYDSIESESLDSSQTAEHGEVREEETDESTPEERTEKLPPSHPLFTASRPPVSHSEGGDTGEGGWGVEGGEGGDGWGSWSNTNTPQTKTSRGIKLDITTAVSDSSATPPDTQPTRDNTPGTSSGDQATPAAGDARLLSPAHNRDPSGPLKRSPSPLATSTPTGRQPATQNKLDSLSREDLVKYIKKQAQVMQKYKTRCDELSKECEKLKSTAPSVKGEPLVSQGLMEELQVMRSERDDAISKERALKQNISSLKLDKQHLGERLQALETEHAKVKQCLHQLQDLEQHREETDCNEREELRTEIASLKERLAGNETTFEQKENMLRELKAKKETALMDSSQAQEKLCQVEGELQSLKERYESAGRVAEEQLCEVRGENDELFSDVATLREKSSKAEDSLQGECEAKKLLATELATLRSEFTQLEQTLHDNKESEKSLKFEKEQLQTSHDQLQASHDNIQQSCDQLTNQVQALESELAKVSSLLETVQREKVSLEQSSLKQQSSLQQETLCELEQVRSSKVLLEARAQELELSLEHLNIELESARSETRNASQTNGKKETELLSQLQELELKSQSLESELSQSQTSASELKTQLGEMESKLEENSAQIASLQFDKSALDLELKQSTEQHDTELAELEASLSDAKAQLETLEEANTTTDSGIANLQTESKTLKSTSSEAAELAALQTKYEELRVQCEEVKGECEEVKGECEVVRRERDAAKKALEEQMTSHKEENKKLKAFIMKMKKENKEKESCLRQQLEQSQGAGVDVASLKTQLETVMAEKDALQLQLEQASATVVAEKQSVENIEDKKVKELETQIEALRTDLQSKEAEFVNTTSTLTSERNARRTELQAASETQDLLQSELSAIKSDLVTAHSQTNTQRMAVERLQTEVQSVKAELARERENLSDTQQKLAVAEKEAMVSSVMNLELEDYQRSIKSLEEELASQGGQLESSKRESKLHQDTVLQLRREIELLGEQRSQSDEKASKMKQLIVKSKKELTEAKKKETELQDSVARLHSQLEVEKQGLEEAKVEISQLTATVLSTQQQADSSSETLQKTARTLEHKLSLAHAELGSTQQTLAQCQQEYDSYKVRVHSVLKQKATPNQAELNSEIRQKYETEILKLKAQLQDTKDQLSSSLTEHEELLLDHEQLASRHDRVLQESREQTDKLQKRLKEEDARSSSQNREQTEIISQLRQEISDVTTAFKTQIHSLQVEHHKQVTSLREELHLAHNELTRMQKEADSRVLAKASNHQTPDKEGTVTRQWSQPDRTSMIIEPRSAGEGMDQAELESFNSFPATPLSREDSQVSFERLLSSAELENSSMLAESLKGQGPAASSSGDDLKYRKHLKAASKKFEHMTGVLRESEEGSMRLSDQAKLLKEEIRRLERNQQREQGVSNMEYLKNVVLKFVHTQGQERSSLVPIITKLLHLSPQEIKFLEETVKGNPAKLPAAGEEVTSPTAGKGWNSYIHRWTGY